MLSRQVYNALKIAADRIGANNYRAQRAAHRRGPFRFHVTPEHAAIVAAMGDRNMDNDTAMAMLHEYETMQQRLAG